jgi:phosphonate transport system ATP-binding protein
MSAIEISGLNKTFNKDNRALRDIYLRIEKGEMVALIGASGSGKSTLLRHIGGLVAADRDDDGGRIKILGAAIQTGGRISSDARRIRGKIGVIFQQFNLVSRLSVLTNVLTGVLGQISGFRGIFGLFNEAEKFAAMHALSRVGIAATAGQRASTLPGGQQQRAAIARALVQGAEIILADEPIASLDPASSKRVMDTLRAINESDGTTVVVSLHQVDYAVRYCPRTVALRAGEVVYDGPSAALTSDLLRDLYGDDCDELLGAAPVINIKKTRPLSLPVFVGPVAATA